MLWHLVLFLGLCIVELLIVGDGLFEDVKEIKAGEIGLEKFLKRRYKLVLIPSILTILIGVPLYLTYGFWINITYMIWGWIPFFGFTFLFIYSLFKSEEESSTGFRDYKDEKEKTNDYTKRIRALISLGIIILLLATIIGRPLWWYDDVNQEQDITSNIEVADDNIVTMEDKEGNEYNMSMPNKVHKDEIRMMPWEIASKHIKRAYGEHAPYLVGELEGDDGEKVIMDDTSPTVYDGHMYWNNIPRYEFIKWIGKDVAGYASLNSSNYEDFEDNPSKFVEKDIEIHKARIGWSKRMQRYVRQTPNYGQYVLEQKRFSLDDNGEPKFIIYLSEPNMPKRYNNLERIIIVNATSGEMEYYDDFEKIPEWMEVVYPDYYVYEWVEWWAGHRKGVFHRWFDKSNIYEPSMDNTKFVMINETSYWYTPMTQSQSNVLAGYVLTNTRTGKSKFYERTQYVDYDTVLEQVDRDLREEIGEHGLDLYEAFLYRLPNTDEEAYVVPIYRARQLAQVAIANPFHATDIVRADSLEKGIELYTGEEQEETSTDYIYPESIIMNKENCTIYEQNDTIEVQKEWLSNGNISMNKSWNNLKLAREHLIQNTLIRIKVLKYQEKIIDVYEPEITS